MGWILDASLWRSSGHIQLGGDLVVVPELTGWIKCPLLPGNRSPRKSWKVLLGSVMSCLACDPIIDKWKIMKGENRCICYCNRKCSYLHFLFLCLVNVLDSEHGFGQLISSSSSVTLSWDNHLPAM